MAAIQHNIGFVCAMLYHSVWVSLRKLPQVICAHNTRFKCFIQLSHLYVLYHKIESIIIKEQNWFHVTYSNSRE